ncbi:MAG: type I DNA topoisomerase [Bacteroidales bacterium]|jgi:DNA topoisomerase-1|nr:type I DNA topoisomerase [Bacteroidales bacterium]
MADNLVIVESPAKAKTIEKFLGKDFVVKSSFGHVRDLSKKGLGIDLEHDFQPDYIVSTDKKKVVTELKKHIKNSKTVWLASDEDREGEAIAWHLYEVLGLKKVDTKRIVFHEITKDAIVHAIDSPRGIDMALVDAQQARRILDRLVGFELSPVLWKKVKPSLSAGRVQSVSVRIIVEREREILNFNPQSSFRILAYFNVANESQKSVLEAELNHRFKSKKEAEEFLLKCKDFDFIVKSIEKKPAKRTPAAPFTTSTLQQEASRKLHFSVSKTMSVAQQLYESGHITYMRTDSVNLSNQAVQSTKNCIVKEFGEKYSKVRKYSSKIKGAQEAHEAIRPTYVENETVSSNSDQQRLYELIRKRTIASQMADAQIEKTILAIASPNTSYEFQAKGEIITFDGFLKVYTESRDDDFEEEQKSILPPVQKNDSLQIDKIVAAEKFSQHPPRYTEASLVRKLEELGIGRPSTYAPTISTIQKRGYVVKDDRPGKKRTAAFLSLQNNSIKDSDVTENFGAEKSKLFPTDIGMVVTDFLVKHFDEILDYNFTASVEEQFDKIAEGNVDWQKMIRSFYSSFHPTVEKTLEHSERGDGERILGNDPESGKQISVRIGKFGPMVQMGDSESEEKPVYASLPQGQLIETITLDEAAEIIKHGNEGRLLGQDAKTGKNIYAKVGRFGPFVQLGTSDDKEKRYVSLLKGQTPESITLDQAQFLLQLPRTLGEFEGKNVVANIGRFGPYVMHNSKFVSLQKKDPSAFEITLEDAIEKIKQKRETEKKRHIKSFDKDPKIKVVLDRWGHPTVFYKRKYHRIAKNIDPAKLSLEDCYKIAGAKK